MNSSTPSTLYIGLDVHKAEIDSLFWNLKSVRPFPPGIVIAILEPGRDAQDRQEPTTCARKERATARRRGRTTANAATAALTCNGQKANQP